VAEKIGTDSGLVAAHPVASSAVVRWGAWAGIVYVLAWLIGLFLAPSAPDAFGPAGTINAYFSAHRSAALVQAVFIHGLAGVALLGLTAALWTFLAAGETAVPRRVMLAAGVVAAAVSFLQVAFMIARSDNSAASRKRETDMAATAQPPATKPPAKESPWTR